MRTKLWVMLLAIVAMVMLAGRAEAQTVTGTLSGRVSDATGAVMPGVKVVVKSADTSFVREVVSNEEGYFLISFLPVGSYQVTVAAQGFKIVNKTGVLVELNRNTISNFEMQPSAVESTVEVVGETPLIETTVGELKHSMDARTIDNIPLAGRNFISLVEQVPGFQNVPWTTAAANNPTNSTGSYAAFSGTGSRSATFQIDGVNNDDSSENQNRQNVNVSTIKEVQVLTNAYSAEFGRAGGAVILVQTKSGTNALHGDLFDFIQNDIFNANGFFANRAGNSTTTGLPLQPRQRVRRNQYGWTIGGPVFKDKLFFFHSGERVANITSQNIGRFIWLPGEVARACNVGEVPARGNTADPDGTYCVDPATHPNLTQDLAFMQSVIDLWNTPELSGVAPNDPLSCAQIISSGRLNRCVTLSGVTGSAPDSDYTGKLDWKPWQQTVVAMRYQYSRQIRNSPRIVFGDNFGSNNNRQYNIGSTVTHVFSNAQSGEFRFGFGNRTTLQDVADGNQIPVVRFANTLCVATFCGTIIGTSTNVPINRRQHDYQFVYNHTYVMNKHTLRGGIDQRMQRLDDVSGDRSRGFWTFSTFDALASILSPTSATGFTGWENFLRGFVTSFQQGYGNPIGENRFGETNLYVQDDWRIFRNLTLNLGFRWEGVRAPSEKENRFQYGYGNDYNNFEPRIGFAWQPNVPDGWLSKLTGPAQGFVIRGGYGIYHTRIFQSIFSQNQLSIRTQPPNGFANNFGLGTNTPCNFQISSPAFADPTICTIPFVFNPGDPNLGESVAAACSLTAQGCGIAGEGVRVAGGQYASTLLIPDPDLQNPYVQQWNLAIERELPGKMALQVAYNGNRGIGMPFYDSTNDVEFGITSPLVTVDVGGGNFQPVVFDRVCVDFSDAICNNNGLLTGFTASTSGSLRSFSALTSTTATLAQKGIVVVGGVPHGYISLSTLRLGERRPDPNFSRNVLLRNFGWTYYHSLVTKLTKRYSNGLSFVGSWVLSKTIDTGSEATFTGVDSNAPSGQRNPAYSLRGLSNYDARHRVVVTYGYDLPWFSSQQGWLGRVAGGWKISGTSSFQSGNPFTVVSGYDVNLDGLGSDRPFLNDPSIGFQSVDNGRQLCPTAAVCNDTISQLVFALSAFSPGTTTLGATGGAGIPLLPGQNGEGTIGRNTFFGHGMSIFDMAFTKETRIREGMNLQFRMEFYNIMNRVVFDLPSARTVVSATPLGRITAQRNPAAYVNAGRDNGSRMGQFAVRFIF